MVDFENKNKTSMICVPVLVVIQLWRRRMLMDKIPKKK